MSSVTRSGKSMRVRCRTGKPPHWLSRIDTKRNAVAGRRMDLRVGRPRFAVVRGCRSGRFRACWRLGAQRLDARARPAPPGAGGVPNCRWFPVISGDFQSIPINSNQFLKNMKLTHKDKIGHLRGVSTCFRGRGGERAGLGSVQRDRASMGKEKLFGVEADVLN